MTNQFFTQLMFGPVWMVFGAHHPGNGYVEVDWTGPYSRPETDEVAEQNVMQAQANTITMFTADQVDQMDDITAAFSGILSITDP